MLIPGVVVVFIYSYIPLGGIVMAFQNFIPAKGLFGRQEWVGLDNFRYILSLPDTVNIVRNTLFIATMKIVGGLTIPILIAILLNELSSSKVRRLVQTLIYLPHFLSWVILGGILKDILSTQGGIVNRFLELLGTESIFFLGNKHWFPFVAIISDIWKSFGFGTIIYLAAITSIDQNLYQAAIVDGANRFQRVVHITLPGMIPIIVLMATLSLGNVLNAGVEQILNLYSPIVYETGDIIDSFIFRIGIEKMRYSIATAVGLFKSVVSMILISVSYYLAYRFADYRIF